MARPAIPNAASLLLLLALDIGVGCGGGHEPTAASAPRGGPGGGDAGLRSTGPARCALAGDAREVLARHARAYGSPDAVAASLPITMAGTLALEGRSGRTEIVVTPSATRTQAWISGIGIADGVDATGPWTLEAVSSGIVERQSGVEAIGPVLDAWLLRRSYVTAFDPSRDTMRCEDVGAASNGSARVDLSFARPELGSPVLAFDLESGALLSVAHERADGSPTRVTYEAWSDAERGIRWPRKRTTHPLAGGASTHEYGAVVHGLECVRFDGTGVAIPERGDACAVPPPNRFTLRWPAGERPVVRMPLLHLGGELLVRAKIGGREVMAFLDSGAGATALDARTPSVAEFHPSTEIDGSGSTQRVRVGFGELAAVDLGELHAEHLPTLSVPIPGLDAYGDKKPDVILGYALMASSVVRIDYKRLEVTFAKSTAGVFAKGGEPRGVPLRVLGSKIVVEGSVEGIAASFVIDTGNAGGLDLYKRWAGAHGLPGAREVVTRTTSTSYRLRSATLGPIVFDGQLTDVGDPPAPGTLAGLAGNAVLARCDAVVFDVAKRMMWLEGACDRPVAERRAGWRFEKKSDAALPDRPWVVGALWPGGAAERAGVQIGDRVLEVGGKPATNDIAPLWALEQQAVGTKVPVVVSRGNAPRARVRLTLELRSPPPP
jgi:hypothetical protein